ncbi:MAG TPA: LamG-like jellyroll fold domain-containing protein, partial [Tissierellaceae bacterium]|nr:LamG-like jellyroll fold domain-containing protein [Tissierellaceae bacterium]
VDLNKPIFSDNTSDPFTISTILKLNDTSPHWILTQRTGSVSGPKVSFETFSSNLRFFLEDASGNRIHTQTSIPVLSEYFLVTITYDGSKEVSGVKMYINSVEVVPNIVTSDVLGDTFGISDLNTGIGSVIESNHAYSMRGSINEMQIWNKVLTQREIQLNMNKELTGHEEGLVGYWKFDDLSDPTVVIDSSPNQNHGTIHG